MTMMKCDRNEFKDALRVVGPVIPRRVIYPISECVLIEPAERGATIKVYDGVSLGVEHFFNAEVTKPICVDGRELSSWVGRAGPGPIHIEYYDENHVQVESGKYSKYRMIAWSPTEFVQLGNISEKETFVAGLCEEDIRLIDTLISPAAGGPTASNSVMEMVFLDSKTHMAVATNSHLLRTHKLDKEHSSLDDDLLVHPAVFASIAKSQTDAEIYRMGSGNMLAICGATKITWQPITRDHNRYVPYEQVMDYRNDPEVSFSVDRAELVGALDRLNPIGAAYDKTRLAVMLKEGHMMLHIQNVDKGTSAEETVNCDYNNSDAILFKISGEYLLSSLKPLSGKSVAFTNVRLKHMKALFYSVDTLDGMIGHMSS